MERHGAAAGDELPGGKSTQDLALLLAAYAAGAWGSTKVLHAFFGASLATAVAAAHAAVMMALLSPAAAAAIDLSPIEVRARARCPLPPALRAGCRRAGTAPRRGRD